MPDVSVTWLGHAAFRIDSPSGKRIYVDPWLDNPKCPENEQKPERADIVALTHGHSDHVGSTVEIAKEFSPEIVALVELKGWLGDQGAEVGEMPGPNKGGTVEIDGIGFTIVNAFHSGSTPDGPARLCGALTDRQGTRLSTGMKRVRFSYAPPIQALA